MTTEFSFKLVERINNEREGYKINRKFFVCLEVRLYPESKFANNVSKEALEISKNLNPGQANTSIKRTVKEVQSNNLLGLLAEKACLKLMKFRYGEDVVKNIVNNTGINQVDILLNDSKTIEVRASCINKGIDFALFAKNQKGIQQMDVIGPYRNQYKKSESLKDYYMRVLYPFSAVEFDNKWKKNEEIVMYIIGGATKNMMSDSSIYKIKHFKPNGFDVKIESDYRVIPIGESLDIYEFFSIIEKENTDLVVYKGLT